MPESTAPEQPKAPPPTPEVVQTPRQRVEASFQQRGRTVYELNVLGNERRPLSPEDSTRERELEQQFGVQMQSFRELVSNEPEAQAWANIERENLESKLGRRLAQAEWGTTPTDNAYGSLMAQLLRQHYNEAVENLKMVHERTLGAGATPK